MFKEYKDSSTGLAGRETGKRPQLMVNVRITVFGTSAGAEDLDRRPGETASVDGRIAAGITDRKSIDRIVVAVLAILADEN